MTQPLLNLFCSPNTTTENPLAHALRGQGWVPARKICLWLNLSDRTIRAYAEQSEGEIISGQNGYKLADEATIDEINHASNWLISQAKKMLGRGIAIKRKAHTRLTKIK